MDLKQRLERILTRIQQAPREENVVHEVEIRLGYKDGKFVSNLGRNNYTKIVELLNSNTKWDEVTNVKQTDYFCETRQVRLSLNDHSNVCVKKARREVWDFPNYNGTNWTVRLSWSTETPFQEDDFGDNADYCRQKNRLRFTHRNKHDMLWHYDATIVNTNEDPKDRDDDSGNASYEFELEVETNSVCPSYSAHSTQLKVEDIVAVVT